MDSGALRCIYWITLFVATLINGMNADTSKIIHIYLINIFMLQHILAYL